MENNTESTIETTETTNTATEAAPKKERPAPAYKAFVSACQNYAEMLGLSVKEQKGYFQFSNPATKHRIVVAKQGKAVTRIDTTLEVLGQDGTLPLEKANGRIACHLAADLATLEHYLSMLASGAEKIRAPKRSPKAASEAVEQASA